MVQFEILLWLAVVLAIQINVWMLFTSFSPIRKAIAERRALNAPILVESIQDVMDAPEGTFVTGVGPRLREETED